jgi:lysophospholipase L1-like esterase
MMTPERRLTRTFRTAGAALFVVLWMEQRWAAHHDFPSFPDLDPSGIFGDPALPLRSIALLGDSTITGPGLETADDIWIRQMVPRLTKRYRVQIDNFAFGGARLRDVLAHQLPQLTGRYDVAFISAGSNDALRGMTQPQMRSLLSTICAGALERADVIVLAGAGDIGTAPRLPFPLDAMATTRARATDVAHARAAASNDRILHVPMWELTTPTFRSDQDLFSGDRFHPNRRGHRVWADAALPTVLAALDLRPPPRR